MGLFDGLGLGIAQAGAGATRGMLAGQQQRLALMRAQQQMQMMNAWHMGQLQTRRDLAGQRIDEQQRQAAGREADSIQHMLQDAQRQADFNRFPGLRESMVQDYNTRRAVQAGTLDWREAPPSKFTDPLTGAPLTPPGTAQTPGQPGAPWVPEASQSESANPYLSEKGHVAATGLDIRGAAQRDTSNFHNGLLDHFKNTDVVAATRENAGLVHQQFADTLDQAKFLLGAGHLSFEEQQGVWAKLLSAGIQEQRAGGRPADALKPLLLNRGAFGASTPNVPAITQYLAGHGYSPDEISNVIGGAGGAGTGAHFNAPNAPTGGGAQAGAAGTPGASGLTPDEQAALSSGNSGLQGPETAVKGSFQSTDGPPVLPQAGTVQAASLPGGGPPTAAQVQSAGGGGARGLAPFNPVAQGAGPGGIPMKPSGIPQPPPLKNPYPPDSWEAGIFDHYIGAHGERAVDGKMILDTVKNNPELLQRASDVIGTANTMQKQGRFSGAPVQDTLGARVPDVPDYSGMQIQMPGVMRLAPNTSTPLTLQGGFQGSFPTAPPQTPQTTAGGPGGGPGGGPSGDAPQPVPDMQMPPFPGGDMDRGPWNQGGSPSVPAPAAPPVRPSGAGGKTGDARIKEILTGETGVPLLDMNRGPKQPAPIPGATTPSPNVYGGGTTGPGLQKVTPPGPGPSISTKGSPSVAGLVQQELKKYRSLPYSSAVEKFFKDRGITDPDQQENLYRWTTAELLPRIRQQFPNLGEKGARAQIYPQLDKSMPR